MSILNSNQLLEQQIQPLLMQRINGFQEPRAPMAFPVGVDPIIPEPKNKVLSAPGLSQALLNLGATMSTANARGLGFGAAFSQGAAAFGNTMTAEREKIEAMKERQADRALAAYQDLARMKLQQEQFGLQKQNIQSQISQRNDAMRARQEKQDRFQEALSSMPEKYKQAYALGGEGLVGSMYMDSLKPRSRETVMVNGVPYYKDTQQPVIAEANLIQSNEDMEEMFKNEQGLRKEFDGMTKDFRAVENGYNKIAAAFEDPSPAGDIAGLIGYMKVLDPGSVVREGEFATAQNAGGVPTRIRSLYNNVKEGTRLTPEQREDFMNQSTSLFNSQVELYNREANDYRRLAEEYKLRPDNIATEAKMIEEAKSPDALDAINTSSGADNDPLGIRQ